VFRVRITDPAITMMWIRIQIRIRPFTLMRISIQIFHFDACQDPTSRRSKANLQLVAYRPVLRIRIQSDQWIRNLDPGAKNGPQKLPPRLHG
jgi:hypothetical protein